MQVHRNKKVRISVYLLIGQTDDQSAPICRYGVITIRPAGGQPPAGLSAILCLAARRA
jgi:hypothetical protein